MARPLVAIVGRPNVGKSMLFNRLAGQRLSIVEDTPGVTRDRLYAPCDWNGRQFDLVDTGGIEPTTSDEILLFMREQANLAIDAADVIVLVTDVQTGVTAADEDVAVVVLYAGSPTIAGAMAEVGVASGDLSGVFRALVHAVVVRAAQGEGLQHGVDLQTTDDILAVVVVSRVDTVAIEHADGIVDDGEPFAFHREEVA